MGICDSPYKCIWNISITFYWFFSVVRNPLLYICLKCKTCFVDPICIVSIWGLPHLKILKHSSAGNLLQTQCASVK